MIIYPFIFLLTIISLILVVIILKAVSIKYATRRSSVSRWFYFSRFEIINSSTESSRQAKKKQNSLSIILFLLIFVSLISFYLFRGFINTQ